MGIGVSIALIAVGAILAFAVEENSLFGISLDAVGVILVISGVLGLIVTMLIFAPRRRAAQSTQPVYDRDDRPRY